MAQPLPQSKKARALLAYLVSTGRSHRRARLCELFWPDVDDPRGGLRWALSRLRPVVDDVDQARLCADAQAVSFEARDALVDVHELSRVVPQAAETAQLVAAVRAYRGAFLEDLELPELLDAHAYFLAERERLSRRYHVLLDALIARHHDDAAAALPFARERAGATPRDEAAQARLIALLLRAGELREAEEHYRAHREWLETQGARPGPALLRAQQSIKQARSASHHAAIIASCATRACATACSRTSVWELRFALGASGSAFTVVMDHVVVTAALPVVHLRSKAKLHPDASEVASLSPAPGLWVRKAGVGANRTTSNLTASEVPQSLRLAVRT